MFKLKVVKLKNKQNGCLYILIHKHLLITVRYKRYIFNMYIERFMKKGNKQKAYLQFRA